jgi:outer membrane protein assembly factor BamE (lipoprotein component of BamABCDE complex)
MPKTQKTLAIAILAAGFATAGAAYADEAAGTVEAVADGIITLADGTVYVVAEGVELPELQAGQNVTITFDKAGENNEVTAVTLAE